MSMLAPADFKAFFRDVYEGRDPFPWQERLAKRVCNGDWPRCIALPTAAGKTACIDIAVFAMAYQACREDTRRTSPRRVFFVVDRRVVVDQAYEHAKKLSKALADAQSGVLKRVAGALRTLAMNERPLDVYALRGGMYRESAWVRSPLQPTIITSTVDQVGSRLLFRGYGVSDSSKPLHAALVGNDALVLLDEAHCAKPFEQTMALIKNYRCWAQEPLPPPFQFVAMTATPSSTVPEDQIERDREDDHAHPVLGPRLKAGKRAELFVAKKASGRKWRNALVEELGRQARRLANEFGSVGVIVNRVATARELAKQLDALLVTGRMRAIDRDRLFEQRLHALLSNSAGTPPQCVVATQCLEVGADFDFHALVTECASLDALRQRFGRLNRVAARPQAEAVIVMRADQIEPATTNAEADPVYGNSIAHTWRWLNDHKDGEAEESISWVDFGVESIRRKWDATSDQERQQLNAPALDAAVLLPAHLDMWCQSSPVPTPDPDPAVFLHGPQRGVPHVQVVLRADLTDDCERWAEIVSLCPPSSSETLPVRADVFRRWLAGKDMADDSSDVEGECSPDGEDLTSGSRRALRWYGVQSERTAVVTLPQEIRPDETYIVPICAQQDYATLGDFVTGRPDDLGDEAFQRARDRAILRLTPAVLNVDSLSGVAVEDEDFEDRLSEVIVSLATTDRPLWLQQAAGHLVRKSNRIVKRHPAGGFVLIGRSRLGQFDPTFIESEESWESAAKGPVLLADHCDRVATLGCSYAQELGLNKFAGILRAAGLLHDVGKADPRFQAWLHGGNRRRADVFARHLAKALAVMPTKQDREIARKLAAYPRGGRHEFHSVRLAESHDALAADKDARDLILHLVASHHGLCRPFAPVIEDANPESFACEHQGHVLRFAPDAASISAHGLERLDSGVAERFWKLTRRFGWWGLPWLETMLRLADWVVSESAERSTHNDRQL